MGVKEIGVFGRGEMVREKVVFHTGIKSGG